MIGSDFPVLTPRFRAEIVRWVSESKRPFEIVNDRGFQSLMKTGRPGYRLPSPPTVSRDVKSVFVKVRKRIAKTLQVGINAYYYTTSTENSLALTRNTTEPSALRQMLGRRQTTRRTLP